MSKSIYLSPSTQGDNRGVGNYGVERDRMNQVCNVVERILKAHGITVYRNNPNMSLSQIVADSNSRCPNVHFAIHSNAGGGRGSEIYCHNFGGTGENLARCIYNVLSPITPTSDRGVKKGLNFYGAGKSMYELSYTNAPAALVEIAFHDNASDAAWIVNNIEAIGTALAKGVLNFFGMSYNQPAQVKSIPQASTSNALYRVIAGSFKDKANADKQMQKLKGSGFAASVLARDAKGLFRVLAGSYAIKDNANKQVQKLKNAGYEAFIVSINK